MSGIVGSKLNIRGSGLVGSLGTDGQHLLSAGAGKTNVFETVAAGGGKVLQVVTGTSTTASQGTEDTFTDTGLNVTITCSASSSLVYLLAETTGLIDTANGIGNFTIERQVDGGSDTNLGDSTTGLSHLKSDQGAVIAPVICHILDSPSTTSEITYEFQRSNTSGGDVAVMYQSVKSSITAMEIDGS